MKPGDLQAASFAGYPGSSRALAVAHLELLRAMPLSLLPSYLQQIEQYPTLFPVEAERLRLQLDTLAARPELMRGFTAITVPPAMEATDWVRQPGGFVRVFSGTLWQTGQIDTYHRAAEELFAALPRPARSGTAPMLIAVMGREAHPGMYPLFTRLRKEGLYSSRVDETGAQAALLGFTAARAGAEPGAYRHWYLDGGEPWAAPGGVERFTYPSLAPVTAAVLREMDRSVREGTGPELLADRLASLPPASLGLSSVTTDPKMERFFVSLLTAGSGTQLYSTSFVQAAAVELIRRAEPHTLLVRFAPRRKPASMNDMLGQRGESPELDPDGALVDADMAVYYAWLAVKRLDARAGLLVWVEGHGKAFAAGPGVVRGGESGSVVRMGELVGMVGRVQDSPPEPHSSG